MFCPTHTTVRIERRRDTVSPVAWFLDFARNKRVWGAAAALLLALFAALPADAMRIKDLGAFQGVRPNQLIGYGIVVGLAGTGDDFLLYASEVM